MRNHHTSQHLHANLADTDTNVFGIEDNILVLGYDVDGTDHDNILQRVLQLCRQVNLKVNNDKYHFRFTSVPVFSEVISSNGVKPDPQKLKTFMEMPPQKMKKELQAFLVIINHLSKFCPSTAEICKYLRQLTSSKTGWNWNATYQKLFAKAKLIITEIACMTFYDETQLLYLETAASGIGLRTALLQIKSGTSCPWTKHWTTAYSDPLHCRQEPVNCRKKIQQH